VIHVRRLSVLGAALAAVAILGLGAASASAADSPTLVDDVAARLGTTPDKLRAAFRDALAARIDAAVKAGKLTPEQGAKLKERLANAKGLGLRLRGRLAHAKHPFSHRIHVKAHGLGQVAKYLDITPQQLRSELRAGKSLAQIATDHGKSIDGLVDAWVAKAKERLDKAVEKGRLTRERADQILQRLTEAAEKAVQRTRPT
jgi:polyhydroxyalkanoate synthesis regulator phasin